MKDDPTDNAMCFICDYGWFLLPLLLIAGLTAYLTRAYWLPPEMGICLEGESSVSLKDTIPFQWGDTDVVFAFDQSGSMTRTINGAKKNAKTLMETIASRFGTERFGVVGLSDYIDFPYRMYQPLTTDYAAVQKAIDGLALADGGDIPESYGRVMYESYTDPNIGWQPNAKRYLVIFGDSYPHDPDPGRDGVLGTGDDLVLSNVLSQLKVNNITMIFVGDPGGIVDTALLSRWQDWAGKTAGGLSIRCTAP
jgi:hypothetical protein